jgi:parallel beta-helix repeat protein
MARGTILVFAVLLLAGLGNAATIYVPDHYPTIQDAINASVNGDTVIVRPGVYVENIDFMGKAITVQSEQGSGSGAGSCTISPPPVSVFPPVTNPVVTFDKGETNSSVLDGFIITNGCVSTWGGGIYCHGSSPTITNNTITHNYAHFGGGGIGCYNYSDPTITNNTISYNHVSLSGGGGGIFCCYDSYPTITNNTILANSANRGGGILCYASGALIKNNSIWGNTAFVGGGIVCNSSSPPIITNTILWKNVAPVGKEIAIGFGTLTISYSDVKGGQAAVYIEPGSAINWGAGMISVDPLFADPVNDDFHLTWNSPCRDTGDNSAVTETTDFENDPRIALGSVDIRYSPSSGQQNGVFKVDRDRGEQRGAEPLAELRRSAAFRGAEPHGGMGVWGKGLGNLWKSPSRHRDHPSRIAVTRSVPPSLL